MGSSGYQVDLSQILGYTISVEFTPWKSGVNWIHHSDEQTYQSQYYEDSGLPIEFLMYHPDLEAWSQTIPSEIKDALLTFETKFIKYAFSALWFVSRSEAACQLLLSSPILMWMVLQHSIENQIDAKDVFEQFYWKRTTLLTLFGLPASKVTLRFLYKYKTKDFDHFEFVSIKQFFSLHDLTDISRIKNNKIRFIRWLIEEPKWIRSGFAKNIGEDADIFALKNYIRDTLRMGCQLDHPQVEENLLNCQTLVQVNEMHDRFIERINGLTFKEHENIVYPLSALDATESIIPILNQKELMIEGRAMKHCIASYHNKIFDGEYSVFKVLEPQRATVGLIHKHDKVVIDQIRLMCNGMPSEETKDKVYWWLQNA